MWEWDEWQMTIVNSFRRTSNLLRGFGGGQPIRQSATNAKIPLTIDGSSVRTAASRGW